MRDPARAADGELGAAAAEGPTSGAVFVNSFASVPSPVAATGLRTEQLRRRSIGIGAHPRAAEEFLVTTRYRRGNPAASLSMAHYFTDAGQVMLSLQCAAEDFGEEYVRLPRGPRLRRDLGAVVTERRSCRRFTGDPVDLGYLAALCRAGAGVTADLSLPLSDGGRTLFKLRAVASGGGVYPVSLYIAAGRVTGLRRAVYRYDAVNDRLWRVADSTALGQLLTSFAGSESIISVERAAAVALLVGEPWKAMRKYGDRGMRYVFLEAGAIAHAVHLAAVALGLGAVECAGYYDDEANEALGLDGLFEAVLHTIILGHPGEHTNAGKD